MKKLSILSIAAASLLLVNCTKNLDSLNHDPKNASTPIGYALFTQGQLNLTNTVTTTSISIAPFRVLAQEWTENSYVYEANYNIAQYNSPGGFWNNLYVNSIHNLVLAKAAYPNNFLGTAAQLRNNLIICDLLEVYAYDMLVATYGNIPYSQSMNSTIPFPKYDDAKTVYADLLLRVDSCIAGLNTSADAMGSADLVYGGNATSWLKFAASLKLKMALLLASVDPATATKKIGEAISTGVFTSNADNALFSYDPASPSNSNPIWGALVNSGRHDFGPCNLLVNTMVGWNDPRLPNYFSPYPTAGSYVGGVPGLPSNAHGSYSDFSQQLQQANLPGDLMDYSEVEFYLAEAAAQGFISDDPALHYNNAITASIQFWEGANYNPSDATTYLAQPSVKYSTAVGSWQQKIGYQEWIAYYNRNWEAWTLIRRLGQPNVNGINPPLQPASGYPIRYTYPPNERTSNSINWAAAVAALPGGADVVTAKLFFMP